METKTSYFERIESNCQPQADFDIDWSAFTTVDFAGTFLPAIAQASADGFCCYDGAELLSSVPHRSGRKNKQPFQVSMFTYPATAQAATAKSRLQTARNEICCFAEIAPDESIAVSFRFGKSMHDVFRSHLKAQKAGHDSMLCEQQTYRMSKQEFAGFFKEKTDYEAFMPFMSETIGFQNAFNFEKAEKQFQAKLAKFSRKMLFEAGHVRDRMPDSWAHGDIERVALGAQGYGSDEIDKVYFGNWLRDNSQIVTGAALGFHYSDRLKMQKKQPFVKDKYVQDLLPTMHYKVTHRGLIEIVNILATREFVIDKKNKPSSNYAIHSKEFVKKYGTITRDMLGVYRPEEHIDNPKGSPAESVFSDKQLRDRVYYIYEKDRWRHQLNTLYPGPYEDPRYPPASYDVDNVSMMKRYIKQNFPDRPSAFNFFSEQIGLAVKYGRSDKGYRSLGAALHVLEDYYAHSNFVEISLIKAGKKNIIPWVEMTPGIKAMPDGPDKACLLPVVTGVFGKYDMYASVLPRLGESILPENPMEFMELQPGERTFSDTLTKTILEDYVRQEKGMLPQQRSSVPHPFAFMSAEEVLEFYNWCLTMRDSYLKFKLGLKQSFPWAYHKLEEIEAFFSTIMYAITYIPLTIAKFILMHVDEMIKLFQSMGGYGTDPTHTELAKDHPDHPLNPLAGTLASMAVGEIALMVRNAWNSRGKTKIQDIIDVADKKYFVHPCFTDWADKTVKDWAAKHTEDIF